MESDASVLNFTMRRQNGRVGNSPMRQHSSCCLDMAITGYDDRFLVFVSRPGQDHIHILKTDYSQEEDDWYAGLESTLQAARTFAMTGEVDESLVWKVQPTQ